MVSKRMTALCRAARTGSRGITDFESFKAWRSRYMKPIMAEHYRLYGKLKPAPAHKRNRKAKVVHTPAFVLLEQGWRYWSGTRQWESPNGFWYRGAQDGIRLSPTDASVASERS